MSEFVNYNHRRIELPNGYKDLIDVLNAKKRVRSIGGGKFSLKNENVPAFGLEHIESYLRRFFGSARKPLLSFFPVRWTARFYFVIRQKHSVCFVLFLRS